MHCGCGRSAHDWSCTEQHDGSSVPYSHTGPFGPVQDGYGFYGIIRCVAAMPLEVDMQSREQHAVLSIALLAAFADGMQDDREREQIKRIAESLAGTGGAPELAQLYQDVLLKRVSLDQASAALSEPAQRQLAYEMAVCVCDSDGVASAAERRFLDDLKRSLGLGEAQTVEVERTADALANAPLATDSPATSSGAAGSLVSTTDNTNAIGTVAAATATQATSTKSDAELDKYILNHAIVNGAIELLPQSLASMAIIPLQMKMVYRIGQSYGHELDKGHIKEFIATAGVGLTSQYLEQAGRKLLGALLGKGVLGGLGRQAVSSGMSFASTYALGHVADKYYAGGRSLNAQTLRDAYQHMMADGRQLQAQYLPQMQEVASGLNTAKIMQMVRGG